MIHGNPHLVTATRAHLVFAMDGVFAFVFVFVFVYSYMLFEDNKTHLGATEKGKIVEISNGDEGCGSCEHI